MRVFKNKSAKLNTQKIVSTGVKQDEDHAVAV